MNVSFEYAKTLCGEGSVLLLLSLVPYVGWVLGIVGVVLLLRGMRELSSYYQDDRLYRDTWTGVKYLIIAIVAAAVATAAALIGFYSATGFVAGQFTPTVTFGFGLAIFLAGLIAAFVFYIFAASHLRRTFNSLAQKTGEPSFATAGTLLWVGALLTIIVVGLLLIFVAWIFTTIGFFTMKSREYQQYQNGGAPVSQSYTQPTTQTS